MRAGRAKTLAVNLLVAVVSTSVVYLAIEFLVFPRILPMMPLDRHVDLHEGIRVLAQSSKAGTVPRDYVAIVGDSYAQGAGDWLMEVDHGRNPPHNVTHLLRERLGRDVVTFGASGAGSLRGLVAEPASQLGFANASFLFDLEAPKAFVVFFYEGNDLDDNLRDVSTRYEGELEPGAPIDASAFGRFMEETVVGGDPLMVEARDFAWHQNLFLANFAYRTARRIARVMIRGEEAYAPPPPEWHPGPVNLAVVGGEVVDIPDVLQGPALELSDAEIELAVDVFGRALAFLAERYPSSAVGVVYLPSPLSSYEIASSTVSCQTYHGREGIYPTELAVERSDRVARLVADASERSGCAFVDARRHLRRASADALVHGPKDWKHYNRVGLEALADSIVELLSDLGTFERGDDPGTRAP
ncbi:MAG: SGNH/GDSL hydrolase family protein [Candidatus Eisenbacteria bacterium]